MTYNPILKKEKIQKILTVKKLPTAEKGTVIILSKDFLNLKDSLVDIKNDEITNAELRWGKYRTSFFIDVSQHQVQLEYELNSIDPIYKFIIKLNFDCSVKNPKKVIEKNIIDVKRYLKNRFQSALQIVCDKYDLKEYEKVKEHLRLKTVEIAGNVDVFNIQNISCKVDVDEKYRRAIEELNKLENTRIKTIIEKQIEQEVEREKGKIDEIKMKNIQNIINGDESLLLYDLINGENRGKEMLLTKHGIAHKNFDKAVDAIRMLANEGLMDTLDAQTLISNITKNILGDINGSRANESNVSYENEEWKDLLSNGNYEEDDD